jgi:predicted nucleic acid-binding protein
VQIILDSNVLFRILISQGDIIDLIFHPKITIYAPEKLREEFIKNRNEILSKSHITNKEFNQLYLIISSRISFIPLEEDQSFLPKAKHLLESHEKDEDFVALALLKQCKIWSYETRLFDLGLAISTKQISNELL